MNKKARKKILITLAIVLAAVIAAIAIIVGGKDGGSKTDGGDADEITGGRISVDDSARGLEVVSLENIAGVFVEDGSDELTEKVMTLTVKNCGDKMLQLAELTVSCDGADYSFRATSVPAGAEVRLMELSRAAMPENIGECTLYAGQLAWDEQGLGMCEDVLSIIPRSNGFVVKNLSDETIEAGHINFYYKNVDNGVYIGGITYHASNNAAIAPGEELAVGTAHFDAEASELMFVVIN